MNRFLPLVFLAACTTAPSPTEPTCEPGQILRSTGSGWECSADTDTNTTYQAGAGLTLQGTTFALDANALPTAGTGLTQTGNTLSLDPSALPTYSAGSGLLQNGTVFSLDPAAVPAYSAGSGLIQNGTVFSLDPAVLPTYAAGSGLLQSGNTFSLDPAAVPTYAAGTGLLKTGNTFSVDPSFIGGPFIPAAGGTMSGELTIDSNVTSGKGAGLVLRNTAGGGGANVNVEFSTLGTTPSAIIRATDDNYSSSLLFMTRQSGELNTGVPPAERMRIKPDGNVGIGMDPSRKLDVNGTVRATTFEGSGSALTNLSNVARSTGTSRVVYGTFTDTATTIGAVNGYSVQWNGTTQRYRITFNPGFSAIPSVTFTQIGGDVGHYVIESFGSTFVEVAFYGHSGSRIATTMFVAAGPN